MDQIELPDLIGEETVDGRRVYRWSDGSLTPVIRGGAGDDEDPDDDEEEEVDDDAEDEESEGDDDDDEDEDEGDEEDEDDDDPEVDAAIDEIVAKVVDKLGDKFDSIADRRINKLVKRLDRKADRGGDDDEPKGRRSRRSQRDDEPEFSVRDARLAGMEIIRDEMPRLSTEDREIARDLLAAEIEKHRGDGEGRRHSDEGPQDDNEQEHEGGAPEDRGVADAEEAGSRERQGPEVLQVPDGGRRGASSPSASPDDDREEGVTA